MNILRRHDELRPGYVVMSLRDLGNVRRGYD